MRLHRLQLPRAHVSPRLAQSSYGTKIKLDITICTTNRWPWTECDTLLQLRRPWHFANHTRPATSTARHLTHPHVLPWTVDYIRSTPVESISPATHARAFAVKAMGYCLRHWSHEGFYIRPTHALKVQCRPCTGCRHSPLQAPHIATPAHPG